MTANFTAGVLTQSSWHGLETVGQMPDAMAMITAGERSGAWPVDAVRAPLQTASGLPSPVDGIVATYLDGAQRVLGAVGGRYRVTEPGEWRSLVCAAVDAGARPTGAFSLADGTKVLATFEVATFEVGKSNGLRTYFMLADSFDGSLQLLTGFTTILVVCCNTLASAMRTSGKDMAKIRHTASAEEKIQRLRAAIGSAIKSGESVRAQYEQAEQTYLTPAQMHVVFDALFPLPGDGASVTALTRAQNNRDEAIAAAQRPENRVGDKRGNLATLWNAATWLVDRRADGTSRDARGGADRLDSLLFGQRAKRVEEIRHTIEIVMRDGTLQRMTAAEARSHGIADESIGRAILAEMLGA